MQSGWAETDKRRLPRDKENSCWDQVLTESDSKAAAKPISVSASSRQEPATCSGPFEVPGPLLLSKRFEGHELQDFAFKHQLELLDSEYLRSRREPKQQICFDYTKGVCKRGTACKYSHDVQEIVRVNSQERGVCFDFLRNSCQRGLLCRFSHDLSSIAYQEQGQKQGRKNAPICYDFVKGVCKREDCRYSHDLFSITRGKGERGGSAPEICYDFTRGKCNRGSACRYAHDLPNSDMALLRTEAVAALAAQHAQIAAAAAVAMQGSRRQSAPGCMQAAPEALMDLIAGLPPHPPAPPPHTLEAFPEAQAGFALQLQAERALLMHLQAQAAGILQQAYNVQASPRLPAWEQLPPGQLEQLQAAARVTAPAPTPHHREPRLSEVPQSQEGRRRTHDGGSLKRPMPDLLVQHLQELNLRHNHLRSLQQMKQDSWKPPLPSRISISEDATGRISANWQNGQNSARLQVQYNPQQNEQLLAKPGPMQGTAHGQLSMPTFSTPEEHALLSTSERQPGLPQPTKDNLARHYLTESGQQRVRYQLQPPDLHATQPGPPQGIGSHMPPFVPTLNGASGVPCFPAEAHQAQSAASPMSAAQAAEMAAPIAQQVDGSGPLAAAKAVPSLPVCKEQLAFCQHIWSQ